MSEADRARRLVESCQLPGYADPEGHEIYPAIEDGVNSIGNALAAAQVLATLAVADELRSLNSGREQFHREVLDVLTQAKSEDVSSLRSGQPAAASGCQECGKPGISGRCRTGPLTRDQWLAHRSAFYTYARDRGSTRAAADIYSVDAVIERFGPCPEES